MKQKPKIVVVVGPTASGKTDLAIKIAKKFNGEIVSADSRQIYRGMDIGTAKPEVFKTSGISKSQFPISKQNPNFKFQKSKQVITTPVISKGIPHYLIDIKNPDENYTVAEYKKDAVKAVKAILKKRKLPILIGGTGLYIKSVIDNLEIPNVPPDPELRKNLELRIKNYGLKSVYDELIELDPEAAYIVDPRNPRRIIRALEIALKTKKPFSAQRKSGEAIFDFIEFGIYWPKEKLDKRINERIDLMMNPVRSHPAKGTATTALGRSASNGVKDGLLKEVDGLVKKFGASWQSFDAIGYREIIDYLKGKTTQEEAVELIKKNTRNYAKRQMTWFKKDKRIHWVKNPNQTTKLIKNFLTNKELPIKNFLND